jgi:hypothetical protein
VFPQIASNHKAFQESNYNKYNYCIRAIINVSQSANNHGDFQESNCNKCNYKKAALGQL